MISVNAPIKTASKQGINFQFKFYLQARLTRFLQTWHGNLVIVLWVHGQQSRFKI